ncbi:MAG: hypothetical protein JWR61_5844 [Ferruginibacter sp.]|uniref:hypothetical protein n=1 Tax=Ferruginibacter sp. TaxID=1940288 RepID=UPI00265A92B8|nr:hypothetical protein [Ferruginibacter sp.]MDB5280889.1 hypothetical protein [Ferruginibacter sp.]
MEALRKLAIRATKLSPELLFKLVLKDKKVQKKILDLNRIDQLFDRGVDSKGDALPPYAKSTIAKKKAAGQEYTHMTLKDKGDFYESFKIVMVDGGFVIEADAEKDGTDLTKRYGKEILGLSEDSMGKLIEIIKERAPDVILEYLLQGLV